MLTLFKNHNIMMPVEYMKIDFGDNPYTIKTTSPPSPKLDETSSKWDWNKMFVPLKETMNGKVNHTTDNQKPTANKYISPFGSPFTKNGKKQDLKDDDLEDDFKYASPFAKKTSITCKQQQQQQQAPKLNPNAPIFNVFNPLNPLNPNAASFNLNTANLNANAQSFHMNINNNDCGKTEIQKECIKIKPMNDDTILAMHGFKKIRKIENSLQGAIYYGETIRGHENISKQLGIPKSKKK
eukprot:241514_1